jgi:hypothetical protein
VENEAVLATLLGFRSKLFAKGGCFSPSGPLHTHFTCLSRQLIAVFSVPVLAKGDKELAGWLVASWSVRRRFETSRLPSKRCGYPERENVSESAHMASG